MQVFKERDYFIESEDRSTNKCPKCNRNLIYMPKHLRDAYPGCAAIEVNYCGRIPTQAELQHTEPDDQADGAK